MTEPTTCTVPVEFLRGVLALCSQRGYSPENIEAWSKDDKWVADLWRQAEQMLAIAKWGTPAPVGVEPVANLTVQEGKIAFAAIILPDGLYDLYTAPQPVGRVPLTHAQAKALVLKYGNDPLHLVYQVEAAHGIKGKTK